MTEKLIELIIADVNFKVAIKNVIGNKGSAGIDNITHLQIEKYLEENLATIKHQLLTRTYKPLPVKRVEIPKPNGGKRMLGVPTLVDRIIQQAIVQVVSPLCEPHFSNFSYGFRPQRCCQNAIEQMLEYVNGGYYWIVDLDLEKFFDKVPHDKLIRLVDNIVKDGDVTSLIMKYLKAGAMNGEKLESTEVGTPQGGPLSPLLSNIMLNELDKEIEKRGLRFVRYADDVIIFVKTEFSAQRVMNSIIKFIENKLHLKVNATKSKVCKPSELKYLGFGFYYNPKEKKWSPKPHEESVKKFQRKLKRLLKRNRSIDLTTRLTMINQVTRGWVNYFRCGSMKGILEKITAKIRVGLRVIIWKQWKNVWTRMQALIKLGLSKNEAKCVANSRKGYQRICHCWSITKSINNERLAKRGFISPLEYYLIKV